MNECRKSDLVHSGTSLQLQERLGDNAVEDARVQVLRQQVEDDEVAEGSGLEEGRQVAGFDPVGILLKNKSRHLNCG
jgi:hypothetical protein